MKKIAILGPNLENRGGVNVVINHLKNYFEKNKIEVHLFPVGKTNIKESEFIHPISSNKKSEQLKILKEKFFDVDLAIANNLRTHALLRELNVKNDLYVFHQGAVLLKKGFFTSFRQKIKFKKTYSNKKLVFLNDCFRNEFFNKFKLKASSFVIVNPFDFEEIRKKAGKKIEGDYILNVGRLTKGKNVDFLINAYKKGEFKEELWILGEGEERKNLESLVKKLNLQKKVRFLGWKENPYPYIKNAKLLVSASKFESFGNILVEALILKTPVVSSNIKCGPSEILIRSLSEFLYQPGHIEELTDKMKKALNAYPEIKEEYIEKYKVENVAKKYLEFLS
ncbi:glycosyltransferase [Caminibacter sp.]